MELLFLKDLFGLTRHVVGSVQSKLLLHTVESIHAGRFMCLDLALRERKSSLRSASADIEAVSSQMLLFLNRKAIRRMSFKTEQSGTSTRPSSSTRLHSFICCTAIANSSVF